MNRRECFQACMRIGGLAALQPWRIVEGLEDAAAQAATLRDAGVLDVRTVTEWRSECTGGRKIRLEL